MVFSRRSFLRNRSKQKTMFQKGHKHFPIHKDSYKSSGNCSLSSDFKRPNSQEYFDAVKVLSDSQTADTTHLVPSKMRPEKDKECENLDDFSISEDSEENVIVTLKKLTNLIIGFMPHNCSFPNPDVVMSKRLGICVSVKVVCTNCDFSSEPVKLYSTMKSPRGPDSGVLNNALLIPVIKSKVGISDIVTIMSCLNIQCLSRTVMQRKVNKMSDLMVDMNKKTMIENQEYVKKVLELAGQDNSFDAEVDSSFNNRPQAGFEAASQTFCPFIEQNTSRKLPVNMIAANTLCPKLNCNHNNDKCKKNYSTDESMASTEGKFVKQHLTEINSKKILKVRSVTSDASAQIAKSVNDYSRANNIPIRHYKCLVHKLRTLQKHLRNIKLTSSMHGFDKDIFVRKLASGIRARIRLEFTRIKRVSANECSFIERGRRAVENVIPCFANDHRNCRRDSIVCSAHLSMYNTSHLPYARHLELNQNDIIKLKSVLAKNFTNSEIQKISRLSTTNKCESLHSKVFSFAPKNTIWTRNFEGLCHSAVHSSSLGNGKSCILLASAIGLKYRKTDPFIKNMKLRDKTGEYHTLRKTTRQYKFIRFKYRRNKGNRKLMANSLFNCANENIINEHQYANRRDFT